MSRVMKFDLVCKNKYTGDIHHKKYFISELMCGVSKLFDVESYEILAKRQYTGKKDINGIEIYDGDKVRWTSGKHFWEAVIEPCRSHPEGQPYAIETINNLSVDEDTDIYTYEVTNSREGSRTEIAFLCRTIEVVGNIHENN